MSLLAVIRNPGFFGAWGLFGMDFLFAINFSE